MSHSTIPANAHDPDWQNASDVDRAQLPANAEQWLLYEGSLTQRLIDVSGGDFAVQRLNQCWCQPLPSETRLLGLDSEEQAMVREVVLLCHGDPWVYARSVMPERILSGTMRSLRDLQNESLGALLFSNPDLQRDCFEVSRLPSNSAYIHESLRQHTPAWARRSRFWLEGASLSVSEVFLEQFQP